MKNSNKKILLVEDDPNFGSILKEYLTLNDYKITLAKNGIEGYEKFINDDFELCILDIMMPYKDGFTLAKEIRQKNELVLRNHYLYEILIREILNIVQYS